MISIGLLERLQMEKNRLEQERTREAVQRTEEQTDERAKLEAQADFILWWDTRQSTGAGWFDPIRPLQRGRPMNAVEPLHAGRGRSSDGGLCRATSDKQALGRPKNSSVDAAATKLKPEKKTAERSRWSAE